MFFGVTNVVYLKNDNRHNALIARQTLLNHVPIPSSQIYPIICAESPKRTAEQYELLLHNFFSDRLNCFDLMLLGLGNDGHTASLFPGTPVLNEKKRWVAELFVPNQDFNRITLTIPLIERSTLTVFLVTGAGKAGVMKEVLEGSHNPSKIPAQLIRPLNGELKWFVDKTAAELLDKEKYK